MAAGVKLAEWRVILVIEVPDSCVHSHSATRTRAVGITALVVEAVRGAAEARFGALSVHAKVAVAMTSAICCPSPTHSPDIVSLVIFALVVVI